MVLLHGQPGTGASWDPVTALLATDFRVLAPDRPGYGSSPEPAVGLAANADAVAELLRERAAAPAVVVGHSWSGGVAVLLGLRHPSLVRSMVLVGAACTPDSVNLLDRLLILPGVGDALTVAGLAGIGGVFPRLRPLARHAPDPIRARLESVLPDDGVTGGDQGVLGRHRRTFMIEQRALLDDLDLEVRIRVEVIRVLRAVFLDDAQLVGPWRWWRATGTSWSPRRPRSPSPGPSPAPA